MSIGSFESALTLRAREAVSLKFKANILYGMTIGQTEEVLRLVTSGHYKGLDEIRSFSTSGNERDFKTGAGVQSMNLSQCKSLSLSCHSKLMRTSSSMPCKVCRASWNASMGTMRVARAFISRWPCNSPTPSFVAVSCSSFDKPFQQLAIVDASCDDFRRGTPGARAG